MLKIKFIILVFLLCGASNFLSGQEIKITHEDKWTNYELKGSGACDDEVIFTIVNEMPKYKPGFEQLALDLKNEFTIDKKVKEAILLRLTINCAGEIIKISNLKNNQSKYAEQIINKIIELENWQAGLHQKRPVNCYKTIGITIKRGKIRIE